MGLRPPSLKPGQPLPARDVAAGGTSVTFGAPAPGMKQLILFERGHWCSACRRHLALVAEQVEAFAERSIEIVAVTHERAVDLIGRTYPFPVFPDPDLLLAAANDLVGDDEYGKRTIRPASLVVDADGVIVFSYVGDDSRDRPTVPALLLAIDALSGPDVGVRIGVPKTDHDAQDGDPDNQ